MRTSPSYVLLCCHLVLLSACEDSTAVPQPDRGSAPDQLASHDGPAPADGPRITDGPRTTHEGGMGGGCPQQLPAATQSCAREGLHCEYGDNPRCLSSAECKDGTWLIKAIKCVAPDPGCPGTYQEAAGLACAPQDAYCNFDGLTCDCTNCVKYPSERCEGPLLWSCEAPSAEPGCPAARPNLGTACSSAGQLCLYGCEHDASRRCEKGAWVPASDPHSCPISTRDAKKDIRYLSEPELGKIARRVRQLRLATYQYKDPSRGLRRRLGYILEDAPDAPSSDMERLQVDLYAYSSAILALAQQQQREITALQTQLDLLRDELGALGALRAPPACR